ncbi:AAA family ATPase [Paenibacillus sinopodophylli]|uniref:AAA family ATPase n=1 Tax=Paenibacillus sinopodophylli TaxID=1837342 RepID=UPI00110CF802|nr:AAA family ATPase [Paenibacillus sinopodophylli]
MARIPRQKRILKSEVKGIVSIRIRGFKSFLKESHISIKPLTILAGSNSSGKSSIFQPILLMKQTLDESYDPGALQLNGPNVKFSSSSQIISMGSESAEFFVEVENGSGEKVGITYIKREESKAGFEIKNMKIKQGKTNIKLEESMNEADVVSAMKEVRGDGFQYYYNKDLTPTIVRNRCFLDIGLYDKEENGYILYQQRTTFLIERNIRNIMHLPGLRGNPERNYPVTAVDFERMNFSGTFEKYVASIIAQWKDTQNVVMLNVLKINLKKLGLAKNIDTKYINDTEIAIYVSRSNSSDDDDIVSIADVGLGLSQTLPILVALQVAKEGQIVYIEQPEIHLHPRAQYELATIFSDAIARGVKIVAETHSSVFLRGIQTLVASKEIPQEKVKLHWFLRDSQTGYSFVESADLDDTGSFGEWPEDFDDTNLTAEANYLNAVEKRLLGE